MASPALTPPEPLAPAGGARIWLLDAHPIYRRGMAACLAAGGFRVVGESDGANGLPLNSIDVLVFAAGTITLRAARDVMHDHDVRLVVLVDEPDELFLADATSVGVAAVLLRLELQPRTLLTTLSAVANGATTLPSQLVPSVLDQIAKGPHVSDLAERELAVLRLLADGEDTRAIADALSYSERTVKNVVHDLLMKMNCRNRAHAVAMATRRGVI